MYATSHLLPNYVNVSGFLTASNAETGRADLEDVVIYAQSDDEIL